MKLQIKNSFHKNYFKTSSIKRIQPPFAFSASFIILSSFLCTMQAVAPTPACANSAGGTKIPGNFCASAAECVSLIFFFAEIQSPPAGSQRACEWMRLPGGKSSAHWPPTRFLMTHTPQSCTIFRLVCGSHRIKKLLARTMRAARYLSTQAHGVGVSSQTFILPAKPKSTFARSALQNPPRLNM